jgi:hypothetical protein
MIKAFIVIILSALLIVGIFAFAGAVFALLWNVSFAAVFGLPTLNLIQGLAILLIVSMLLSPIRSRSR